VTAPRENLYCLINDVHLNPITVELNLMEPELTAGHFFNRGRQCRLDKARIWIFGADTGGFLRWKGTVYTSRNANWR